MTKKNSSYALHSNAVWKYIVIALFALMFSFSAVNALTITNTYISQSPQPTIYLDFDEYAAVSNPRIYASNQAYYDMDQSVSLNNTRFHFSLQDKNNFLNDGQYTFKFNAKDRLDNSEEFVIKFNITTPFIGLYMLNPHNGIATSSNVNFVFYTSNPANCRYSYMQASYDQMSAFTYSDTRYHLLPDQTQTSMAYSIYVTCNEINRNRTVSRQFDIVQKGESVPFYFTQNPEAKPATIIDSATRSTNAIWRLNDLGACKCSQTSSFNLEDIGFTMSSISLMEQSLYFFGYDLSDITCDNYSTIALKDYAGNNLSVRMSKSTDFKTLYGLASDFDEQVPLYNNNTYASLYKTQTGNARMAYAIINSSVVSVGTYANGIYTPNITNYQMVFVLSSAQENFNFAYETLKTFLQELILYDIDDYTSVTSLYFDSDYLQRFFGNVDGTTYNYYVQCQDLSYAKKTPVQALSYNTNFSVSNYIRVFRPLPVISDVPPSNRLNFIFYTPKQASCYFYLTNPNGTTTQRLNMQLSPDRYDYLNGFYDYGYYYNYVLLNNNIPFPEGRYNLSISCPSLNEIATATYEFYLDRSPPTNVTISAYNYTCPRTNNRWILFKYNGTLRDFSLRAMDASGIANFNITLKESNLSALVANYFVSAANNVASARINLANLNVNLSPDKTYFLIAKATDISGLVSQETKFTFTTKKITDPECKEIGTPTVAIAETQLGNKAKISLTCRTVDGENCPYLYYMSFPIGAGNCSDLRQSDFFRYNASFNITTNSTICALGEDIYDNNAMAMKNIYIATVRPDSDSDGLPDDWEQDYFDCKTCAKPSDDPDKDCMSNLIEFQRSTDPTKADTDGDAFTDGEEAWSFTDPVDPDDSPSKHIDSDADGIADWFECKYFGCRTCASPGDDYDGDGLTNLEEFKRGTDPTNEDTDGDGYTDGEEIDAGTNPKDKNDHPEFRDADKDGLPDDWEQQYFNCKTCANPGDDPDNDGLTNIDEFRLGTDPTSPDTDTDGWNDKIEINYATDPKDADSHPTSKWAILGYVLGLLLVLALIIVISLYIYKKLGEQKKKPSAKPEEAKLFMPKRTVGLTPEQISKLRHTRPAYSTKEMPFTHAMKPEAGKVEKPAYAAQKPIWSGAEEKLKAVAEEQKSTEAVKKFEAKTGEDKVAKSPFTRLFSMGGEKESAFDRLRLIKERKKYAGEYAGEDIFALLRKLSSEEQKDVFELLKRLGGSMGRGVIDEEAFRKLIRTIKKKYDVQERDVYAEIVKFIEKRKT